MERERLKIVCCHELRWKSYGVFSLLFWTKIRVMKRQIFAKSLIAERGWGFWALEEKSSGCFYRFHRFAYSQSWLAIFTLCRNWMEAGSSILGARTGYWGSASCSTYSIYKVKSRWSCFPLQLKAMFDHWQWWKRLGMVKQSSNFEHPALPVGHKLREHALYKIKQSQWVATAV